MIKNILILLCLVMLQAGIHNAAAHHKGNIHIDNSTNNYPTEVIEIRTNTITSGLSDEDMREALAGAGAVGSHQFDYSTTDYQASITGAFMDSEDAVSFGIGKRWTKVDALFHGSYTRITDEHLWVIGGTFRF